MPLPQIDPETASLLERFGFDTSTFERLRAELREGGLDAERNQIPGRVEVPQAGDVAVLPEVGTQAHAQLVEKGKAALKDGAVGAVVLAGGMATRFGGAIKALVPAAADQSFLQLKIADAVAAAAQSGGRVPLFLMSSFATDAGIREAVASASTEAVSIEVFPQLISLRVRPDGELFKDSAGALSPNAPGHGDLTFALHASGILARFRESGGKLLVMSNVDNLAATLDPAVIGAHLEAGVAMTAEVVRKFPGDAGGAPARVDGRLELVESFRFPPDFDQDSIPVFNTNTFVLDAAAIDRDFDLSWFFVQKKVDGAAVVQFEHLVGQLTAFLETQVLEVPREGTDSRFIPVKTPQDLETARAHIEAALSSRGVL